MTTQTDIYKHIADKIKSLRELYAGGKGISQESLSLAINVASNTVSRWETCTYKPRIDDLEKLAKFFSVPIYTFLPVELHPQRPELNALFSATSDLKKEDIETLTEFALFRRTRSSLNEVKKLKK